MQVSVRLPAACARPSNTRNKLQSKSVAGTQYCGPSALRHRPAARSSLKARIGRHKAFYYTFIER